MKYSNLWLFRVVIHNCQRNGPRNWATSLQVFTSHSLTVWPWASFLTPLSPSIVLCKMGVMLTTPFSPAYCERKCIMLSTVSGTNRRYLLANGSYCFCVDSFSSFILLHVSAAPRWYFLFKTSLLTRSSKAMRWQRCSRVSCRSKRQTFWYSEPWKSILSVSNSGKLGMRT